MSPVKIAVFFAVLLVALLPQATGDPAKPCTPNVCKLPGCFCSGTNIPGNLSASSIPQIVMISFDSAINTGFSLYEELFDGRFKNPNKCNISATFFVSHEYSNYCMVQKLYSQRHEIADNSISRKYPQSWWANATVEEYIEEIAGMREILRKFGYVNPQDVKGFRVPYIQVGGNNEFKALIDLDFLYESSMPTQMYMKPPLWPYTLDYRSTQDCVIGPCPTDSFPGVWEVPLVDYIDTHGGLCNIIDSCAKPNTAEEAFNLLDSNFQRHYKTNKAPFFMLLEEDWLANSIFFEGTVTFLKKLASMNDVWVVTVSQAIEWIKSHPTLENIKDFAPWKCDSPAPPDCPSGNCRLCNYPERGRVMSTCAPGCPPNYPWVGNPDGN
ncbi:hypothetical protein ACROYT_G043420 [Oculina patagonica]